VSEVVLLQEVAQVVLLQEVAQVVLLLKSNAGSLE
jgi:hypothetical protein